MKTTASWKRKKKDCYGSSQNPHNEKLDGLLFSACVDWTKNPTQPFDNSLYGPKRLQLRARELITCEKHLYFTDFYSMASSKSIQLVLCNPGSDAASNNNNNNNNKNNNKKIALSPISNCSEECPATSALAGDLKQPNSQVGGGWQSLGDQGCLC